MDFNWNRRSSSSSIGEEGQVGSARRSTKNRKRQDGVLWDGWQEAEDSGKPLVDGSAGRNG
jgi:hypothetical protein